MFTPRPQPDEYGTFFGRYVNEVSEDVLAELEDQLPEVGNFLYSIPADKHNFAYAEGKWTVKELVGHLIDTERIMAYRVLRFSRKDSTELPGFEENDFVLNSTFQTREFTNLIDEFIAVRKSNLYLIKALGPEQLDLTGIASNNKVSVRALVYIIAGHFNHHIKILKERYLNPAF